MLFTCLDLTQMFYSVRLTKRSQAYLCFYSLTDDRLYQFPRLVMGLKTAPFIASMSLQLVLNQENFEKYVNTLDNANLKKELN